MTAVSEPELSGTRDTTPGASREAAAVRRPLMSDPIPIALALFGFALAIYFVRFQSVDETTLSAGPITVGLNYAVLVAGIGETLGGILGIIRGNGYAAYVVCTFGIWLLGFFLLVTTGAENKEFTPNALAWYSLLLIVPVVILAVPSFAHRNIPFAIAFLALIGLLLFLGLGYHEVYNQVSTAATTKKPPQLSSSVNLLKTSGWFALAAAIAIWAVFAKEVYEATGLLRRRTA